METAYLFLQAVVPHRGMSQKNERVENPETPVILQDLFPGQNGYSLPPGRNNTSFMYDFFFLLML